MKYIPNCLTAIRMIGTLCLIPLASFSKIFYIVYIACGITDVLDGAVARKTGNVTEFGSKFDSASDLLFYIVMMIKMLPALRRLLPIWVWGFLFFVIAVRMASYLTAAVKYRKFASCHTYMNKITGGAVFTIPFFLPLSFALGCAVTVCSIAFIASAEELLIHLLQKEYDSRVKSIISVIRKRKNG